MAKVFTADMSYSHGFGRLVLSGSARLENERVSSGQFSGKLVSLGRRISLSSSVDLAVSVQPTSHKHVQDVILEAGDVNRMIPPECWGTAHLTSSLG